MRAALFVCYTLLVVLLSWLSPIGAKAADPMVRIEPEYQEMAVGEEADFDVVVRDVENLSGVEIWMAFNPAILRAVDLQPDKDGTNVQTGDYPQPDFVAKNEVNNQEGLLRYVVTKLHSEQTGQTSGTVFTVRFRARNTGPCDLEITKWQLVGPNALTLDVQAQDGQVVAVTAEPSAPPPTATPTPDDYPVSEPTPSVKPTAIPTTDHTRTAVPTASPTKDGAYPGPTDAAPSPTPTEDETATGPSRTQEPVPPTSAPLAEEPYSPQGATAAPTGGASEPASEEQPPEANTKEGTPSEEERPGEQHSTLTPTPERYVKALPTIERRSPGRVSAQEQGPLIPQELFTCAVVLLVLFTIVLGLYLARSRQSGSQ
jgi:hypothetical protein